MEHTPPPSPTRTISSSVIQAHNTPLHLETRFFISPQVLEIDTEIVIKTSREKKMGGLPPHKGGGIVNTMLLSSVQHFLPPPGEGQPLWVPRASPCSRPPSLPGAALCPADSSPARRRLQPVWSLPPGVTATRRRLPRAAVGCGATAATPTGACGELPSWQHRLKVSGAGSYRTLPAAGPELCGEGESAARRGRIPGRRCQSLQEHSNPKFCPQGGHAGR